MEATKRRTRRGWRMPILAGALAICPVVYGASSINAVSPQRSVVETTATTSSAQTSGGELRVAVQTDASSLDPHVGTSGDDHVLLYPAYDTLFALDPTTLEPQPALVASWEWESPTVLVLHLQEGVQFHDGTPFDAEAVKANIEREQTLENSAVKSDVATIAEVVVRDALTVEFQLSTPDSALLGILADRAGMMVSPAAAEDPEALGRQPVGTGPFEFAEWEPGNSLSYTRNDTYWRDGLPYLDGLTFRIISDPLARVNGLIAGDVDFVHQVDPRDRDRVEADEDLTLIESSSLLQHLWFFNMGRPPLDDVRVRQAINLAIDREALVQVNADGAGEPSWILVPSEHWAYTPDVVPSFPHDPDEARRLLDEAGYGDGLTLEVITEPNPVAIQRGEIVQAQLADVGIQLELVPTEVSAMAQVFFQDQQHDAVSGSFTARPDPSTVYQLMYSADSFFNVGKYAPEGMQDLIDATRTAQTQEERVAAFEAVNQMAIDNALWVPLYFPRNLTAYVADLEAYTPSLLGKPNFTTVSLGPG